MGHVATEWWQLMIPLKWHEEWVRRQAVTHSYNVLLEGRASTCEVKGWKREITQHAHTHAYIYTRTHHPGYPSRSFPPDAEATGTVSRPLSTSLRAAPSFLDRLHSPEQPGYRTYSSPVKQLTSPKQARRNSTVHTHLDKERKPTATHSHQTETCSKQSAPSSDLLVTVVYCIF